MNILLLILILQAVYDLRTFQFLQIDLYVAITFFLGYRILLNIVVLLKINDVHKDIENRRNNTPGQHNSIAQVFHFRG